MYTVQVLVTVHMLVTLGDLAVLNKVKIYPNNKSYVTKDIMNILNTRKAAFRNKDIIALK